MSLNLPGHLKARFRGQAPRWLRPHVRLDRARGSRIEPPLTLEAAKSMLRRLLAENVLPFWLREAADEAHGGYRLNHDVRGRWRGPAAKRLVTQSRVLWFFAQAIPKGGEQAAAVGALARRGFDFLANRLWDEQHGGFYWEVDARGGNATMTDKHAYGQAQALYALSDYAAAARCEQAGDLARATFALLEEHFHDPEHGGYEEFLARDLQRPPAARAGYLGAPPAHRLVNTHLHLIEALTAYTRLTGDERAHSRLLELLDITYNAIVRADGGTLHERHARDWTPLDDGRRARSSHGHDVEAIHLLIAAHEALGEVPAACLDLGRRLFDHALRCGEDPAAGGFWASGPPGARADDLRKVWWVQAEAALAAVELLRLTGEARYRDALLRTLGWIEAWQVDWSAGEWHAEVVGGRAYGAKAGKWKGPYHNGRMLIQGLDSLDSIG